MIRELALFILLEVMENGAYSNEVIHDTLIKYQYLNKQDRAFLTRLAEGTVERCIELDYMLNSLSRIPVSKMKPVIRNILRLGAYQILYMEKTPDSAACNESVKLAEKKGFRNLKGFVNGVLRSLVRKKNDLEYPKEDTPEYLTVAYSMPEWIVSLWLEEYDRDTVAAILSGFLEEKNTTIRVNTEKITKEALVKRLQEENVKTEDGNLIPDALFIREYNYLNALPSFREGLFSAQDESSMLAAYAAGIKKGDRIIDVCAAPGGKALHAAQLLGGSGEVIARDLTEKKINLLEDNIKRLGLHNIKAQQWDALKPDDALFGKADVAIADLPCSGLGVMKRKGDVKYKTKKEDVQELARLQREILKVVWQYVRPGGILMYSTCTINHYENMDNIAWFTSHYPFTLQPLPLPKANGILRERDLDTGKEGYLQLLPGIHKTDGFFLCRLMRNP